MISFLSDRLNTNYSPTPIEILSLQRVLSGPEKRLADIGKKVCELEEHLRELNQQRDALEDKVTGYQGMFSPARRLLPEVLQEIFIHCLPTDRNPAMSATEAPLLLGRVCRQWRDVAYSTPTLWSGIHISIPFNSPFVRMHTCSHAVRAKAVNAWLLRSGVCPLSISLSAPYFDHVA